MNINELEKQIIFIYEKYMNKDYKFGINVSDTVAFADCIFIFLKRDIQEKINAIKKCLANLHFDPIKQYENYVHLVRLSHNSSTLVSEEIMLLLTERISLEVDNYYYCSISFDNILAQDNLFFSIISSYKENVQKCINNIMHNRAIIINKKKFIPEQYKFIMNRCLNITL